MFLEVSSACCFVLSYTQSTARVFSIVRQIIIAFLYYDIEVPIFGIIVKGNKSTKSLTPLHLLFKAILGHFSKGCRKSQQCTQSQRFKTLTLPYIVR